MPKNSQKEVRKDAMLKIGMVLLVVLIIANTIQLSRFGEIVERVDRYNRGVVDELGGFRQDIMTFGSDMNEMRSFLLLPTKDYSFADQETVIEDDAQETSSTEKAIYQFMGSYTDEQRAKENFAAAQERMNALNSNQELKTALKEKELSMSAVEQTEESSSFKVLAGGEALYAVIADKKSNTIRIQSALGTKDFDKGLSEEAIASELATYVGANKEKVAAAKEEIEGKKAGIVNLASNQELSSIINEKGIQFDINPEENEDGFHYSFLNSEGTKLLTIDLLRDGQYQVNGEGYGNEEQLAAVLINELKNSNSSTALEQMVAERRTELETIFQDPAFQELLSSNNLTVAIEPREDYNKVLYDVTDANGNVQFSFVIELSSGLFKVLQDNEEIDLYSILLGSKKKL